MGIIKDPTSWRAGFELGLAGFSFPYSKPRKPTAYLYNGIRLPALPEWDKGVYPYAVIYGGGNFLIYGAKYVLQVSDEPIVVINDDGTLRSSTNTDTDSFGWWKIKGTTGANWEFYAYDKDSLDPAVNSVPLIWSNHDVINTTDNSVYLAASDPVPVYE